jgi:hypothetical protein
MSSMLEQAIIDATALKEAAIKNAEAAIIEKYAPEVKRAVSTLLEQPEDLGMDPGMDMGADMGMPAGMETGVDLAPAAAEGENLCPCPDEGEEQEIEVDIDQLRKMALQEPMGEPEDLGALAGEMPLPGEEEEELALQEEISINDDLLASLLEEDEDEDEVEINEENISDIIEELVVDMEPQKTGWLGTGLPELEHAAEMEMARRKSTEYEEEEAEYEKAIKELEEQNTALKKHTFKLKEALTRLTGDLNDLNLSNARLLYTNRTLNSISLNERQKNKIVQAISNAGSVEEAKTIFETLQSTVGSTPTRRGPQSLSEAVSRPSTSLLSGRGQQNQTKDNSFSKRMKELAGIK